MLKNWLRKAAVNKNLRGEDFRVLLFLISSAEGETIEISQSSIARSLDLNQSRVSRAIKNLSSQKIISFFIIAEKLIGYRFLVEDSQQKPLVDEISDKI